MDAARFAMVRGMTVRCVDTREHPPLLPLARDVFPNLSVQTGVSDVGELGDCSLIVKSPGLSMRHQLVQSVTAQQRTVLGILDLASAWMPAPRHVIAVTGTNGKSSAVSFIAAVLRAYQPRAAVVECGNYGYPILSAFSLRPEWAVVELSSFQLETQAPFACEVSVVLNVQEDHLDVHGTMDHYAKTKRGLHRCSSRAIFNERDLRTMPEDGHPCAVAARLETPGAVASAVATVMGVPHHYVDQVARAWRGLPHRGQTHSMADFHVIDDSKATNVAAVEQRLRAIEQSDAIPPIWLLGGRWKQLPDVSLMRRLCAYGCEVVCFGESGESLEQMAQEHHFPITRFDSLRGAAHSVRTRAIDTKRNIVLSPGGASQDEFSDFAERGRQFVQWMERGAL